METHTINYYEFDELDDYGKEQAIYNFKHYSSYEYAYCWSREKIISTIHNGELMFKLNGEFAH